MVTVNIVQGNVAAAPTPPDTGSQALSETGKEAVNHFIDIYTDPSKPGPTIDPGTLVPGKPIPASPYPVGILGAGIGGLYAALMLESLGIKYEIMEGSGRIGGRLYTHNFPKNAGQYQYYVSLPPVVTNNLSSSYIPLGCRCDALPRDNFHAQNI